MGLSHCPAASCVRIGWLLAISGAKTAAPTTTAIQLRPIRAPVRAKVSPMAVRINPCRRRGGSNGNDVLTRGSAEILVIRHPRVGDRVAQVGHELTEQS